VNIGMIGGVAVGKSSFINMLFSNYILPCTLNKSSLHPQSYTECSNVNDITLDEYIYDVNHKNNTKLCDNDDIKIIEYNVKSLDNTFNKMSEREYKLKITYFPGSYCASEHVKYTNFVEKNLYKMDIIIMMLDITSGVNTINQITKQFKENNFFKNILSSDSEISSNLIVVVNKCDNVQYEILDRNSESWHLNDDSHDEIFKQINNIVNAQCTTNIIIPLACKNILTNQILLNNHDNLTTSDIDYLGSSKFGNIFWSKLNLSEKRERLYDYSKNNRSAIVDDIVKSGFIRLRDVLRNLINDNIINYQVNSMMHNSIPLVDQMFNTFQQNLINIKTNKESEIIKYNVSNVPERNNVENAINRELILRICKYSNKKLDEIYCAVIKNDEWSFIYNPIENQDATCKFKSYNFDTDKMVLFTETIIDFYNRIVKKLVFLCK